MQWMSYLLVALGGALGAMARFGLAQLGQVWGWSGLPWATLLANTLGSFAMGALAVPVTAAMLGGANEAAWAGGVRALIMVGFLGAFTTYSSFSLEVWRLAEGPGHQASLVALAYGLGTLVLAVLACGLGLWVAGAILHLRAP